MMKMRDNRKRDFSNHAKKRLVLNRSFKTLAKGIRENMQKTHPEDINNHRTITSTIKQKDTLPTVSPPCFAKVN